MADEGRIIFNRPPRIQRSLPQGKIEIPKPPEAQFKGTKRDWAILLLPIILAVLTMTSMAVVTLLRPNSNPLFLITTMVMSVGFVANGTLNLWEKLGRDRSNREEYIGILDRYEKELNDSRQNQQTILHYLYPALPQIVNWPYLQEPHRLWERRPQDPDFMNVRMGIGAQPSSIEVTLGRLEKHSSLADRARYIATSYREVPDVPFICNMPEVASLGVVGTPTQTAAFIRGLISHFAAHHAPDDLKIMATYASKRSAEWSWLGWLPHTRLEDARGTELPLLACQADQVDWLCNGFILETLKRRKNQMESAGTNEGGPRRRFAGVPLLWIVDDFELIQDEPAVRMLFEVGAELGVYLITSATSLTSVPERCRATVEIRSSTQALYAVTGERGVVHKFQPEFAQVELCEKFALRMAPVKLRTASDKGDIPRSLRMLEMFDLNPERGDVVDPLKFWNKSPVAQLKVPIGRVFGGQLRELDLSDKGHGPHGLIAGTTGSGKSILLQTVICALALSNHPDNLNFVLGDFKGGATINPFKNLPHVVGMMTNHDLTIVERAMTALFSELKRREKLLEDEGVTHIRDYQKKKPRPKVPMPYLVVILDEFAELKEQAPDFIEKVINIARKGRTLGVHLILATQKPAGVVTGQLNSNTKFRLCLRVETAEDSVDMIGRKDAALLSKDQPGRAFFKLGNDIFEQFQVANTEIQFAPSKDDEEERQMAMVSDLHSWRLAPLLPPRQNHITKNADNEEDNRWLDYNEITRQCEEAARRTVIRNTHKPWLDPMGKAYYLTDPAFLGDKGFSPATTLWPGTPPDGSGRAPMALADNVVDQKQEALYFDLLKDGSYCISGVARTGKTNLLYTMLTALALTHTPEEICFYLMDMGNTLKVFSQLPHPLRYVPMTEASSLREVFKDLTSELQRRKTLFANKGVLEMEKYRELAGPGEKLPLIFVAFDNYASIRHSPPFDMEMLKALVREGRNYGISVAITMDRAQDFEFGRMAEQFFLVVLRQSRDDIIFPVPKNMIGSWNDKPGRGFIKGGANRPPLEIQVLLPCKDDPENQLKALEKLVAKMREAAMRYPEWARLKLVAEPVFPANPVPKPSTPPPVTTTSPAPTVVAPALQTPVTTSYSSAEEEKKAASARNRASSDYWASIFKPKTDPAIDSLPAQGATPVSDEKQLPVASPVPVINSPAAGLPVEAVPARNAVEGVTSAPSALNGQAVKISGEAADAGSEPLPGQDKTADKKKNLRI